jgi:hypothetical protein
MIALKLTALVPSVIPIPARGPLENGCIATLEPARVRVRLLPIGSTRGERSGQPHLDTLLRSRVPQPRRCDPARRERRPEPYVLRKTDLIHTPQHSPTNELCQYTPYGFAA